MLRFCQRTKKMWNMSVKVIPDVVGALERSQIDEKKD